MTIEVKVPDIGDFKDVPVIDILVKVGDSVKADESLLTLESDKAAMDIPSPVSGKVAEILVKTGDKVSEGTLIMKFEGAASQPAAAPEKAVAPAQAAPAAASAPKAQTAAGNADIVTETLVLGAGPGGYTAAFRAADLGQKVALVERYDKLGGVCLNVGCIPSKALLHAAKVITEADEMATHGVTFGKPDISIDKLRKWKESVISKLTGGLKALAKQRKVEVVCGVGRFESPTTMLVDTAEGTKRIQFKQAIIASGSKVAKIPGFPYDDPRLIDSTGALELADVPKRLLVIGGGIIGLEMACVYDALGAKVTVVEFADGLIPAADRDIIKPLQRRAAKRYEAIYTKTKVAKLEAKPEGLLATFESADPSKKAPDPQLFDKVLLSVGRTPNGNDINAQAAGIIVNEKGFIPVDKQQRTNVPNIYAIGDVVGNPMLAHKAVYEGKIAAEVISGEQSMFDAQIPSVAYTDPEIAWIGITEEEAAQQGIEIEKASFPWVASGRALSIARDEGITKLLFDKKSKRLLGGAIVGTNAGELLGELGLAIEMGANAEDIAMTIHAHPTLSETAAFAAEMVEGTITDLYMPKKK